MLKLLSLLLPALIPSWRFFKEVGPSPRVEYRLNGGPWHLATARPGRFSPVRSLRSLVWNPHWNDTLYLISLSERLLTDPDRYGTHVPEELRARIARRVPGPASLEFRILLVSRDGTHLAYQSTCHDV